MSLDNCICLPCGAGTSVRSLHLRNVELEGSHDFKGLSTLTGLTSLTLAGVQCSTAADGTRRGITFAMQDSVPALLEPLSCLVRLSLTDAHLDALSHLRASLTRLCCNNRRYAPGTFELSHIARQTALDTLAWGLEVRGTSAGGRFRA